MEFKRHSIEEIRAYISDLPCEQWMDAVIQLSEDSRSGVRRLGEGLQGKIQKSELERMRLETMAQNDQIFSTGSQVVCGVDEAGRGPLAGPVVAAAVILPPGFRPFGLDDSKKVAERHRDVLYDQIIQNAQAWGVGIISPQRIDEINILEATREAMLAAVHQMALKPDFVLLDAVEIKALSIPHKGIIKGDEKCLSIAAASIIAKVTRDRVMTQLGIEFPQYGFGIHKGYGTAMHYEALERNGLTLHHRRSFLKNWQQ